MQQDERRRPRGGRAPIVRDRDAFPSTAAEGVVYGRNEVRELLRSGRSVDKIFVRRGDREGSINVILGLASERGIPVIEVEREKLDQMCGGGVHQGVAAMAAQKEYCEVDDILRIAEERGEMPLIVILDGVEDPYNLGAVIRCAECAGAHGLIIPKRRAAGLTATAAKASAGAVEHLAVAKVANLASEIDKLKERGIWLYAAEAGGENLYEVDLSRPSAFVFGSEGSGVSRLVKEKCDYIVSIPLYGKVNSLNVSTAAAVVLNEAAHRRHSSK
ncbi:MAG: 23S rRNA (guanosine(2251)-2'-O)-methyltransferase RlmB [Clostridia bacterium]|nr:23S rRNA (guanosine(2251)-2'-O)-methyltransferase RlmB [Clostridia bacterium]